jgi:hypothetical protein
MKTNLTRLVVATICSFVVLSFAASSPAQGTTFTYQGRLDSDGNVAAGMYDLRFTIYDSAGGDGVVAGPLTNSPTTVSNGLFTVTLDFGPGVFTGAERWLEIGVRSSGAGAFQPLAPRQRFTATPYAITAGGVSGTISSTALPSGGPWPLTSSLLVAGETLVIDPVNQRVGIGTATPFQPLEIVGAAEAMVVAKNSLATGFAAGVWGQTASTTGRALQGYATATTGTTYGLHAQNDSSSGQGVFGFATAPAGTTFGVRGRVISDEGYAGYFEGGRNYFEGRVGIGVTNGFGTLEVQGSDEMALVARNYRAADFAVGLLSETYSLLSSRAVVGYALGNTGNNMGVVGQSDSSSGHGVFGLALADNGTTYGVRGRVFSDQGYAGYFEGGQNYFERHVGLGTLLPAARLHLYGTENPVVLRLQSTGTPGLGRIEFVSNPQGDGNEWRPAFIQSTDAGGFTGGLAFYVNGTGAGNKFAANEVMRIQNGRVGIGTNSPTTLLQVGAATCNGTTWANASDRDLKENFEPVHPAAVLAQVLALPIARWNYKQDTAARHLGPMAQDFRAAFGLGGDDKAIATVDADGVALAAIQGLNQKVEVGSQRAEDRIRKVEADLKRRDAEITKLQQRLAALERLVSQLNPKGE